MPVNTLRNTLFARNNYCEKQKFCNYIYDVFSVVEIGVSGKYSVYKLLPRLRYLNGSRKQSFF
jgi:hypothetical protein